MTDTQVRCWRGMRETSLAFLFFGAAAAGGVLSASLLYS